MPCLATLDTLTAADTLGRLLLATIAGGIVGWEREHRSKPAGLRTHMLVALGAAVFIVITLSFTADELDQSNALRLDPTRVISYIIGGVGFLGAGTIIEARGRVQGITTAASIWVAAAIGTACGLGYYLVGFLAVLLAVATLFAVGFFEVWLYPQNGSRAAPSSHETGPDH